MIGFVPLSSGQPVLRFLMSHVLKNYVILIYCACKLNILSIDCCALNSYLIGAFRGSHHGVKLFVAW